MTLLKLRQLLFFNLSINASIKFNLHLIESMAHYPVGIALILHICMLAHVTYNILQSLNADAVWFVALKSVMSKLQ